MIETHWLHIWDGISGKVFLEINKIDLAQLRKHYGDYCQVNYFAGRKATIVTISDSRYTSRGECLEYSRKFVVGEYWLYEVNLDKLETTRKKGVPIGENPR
jgi:hypothetical protein